MKRLGLWLLKRAGWHIPQEILKRVYTPVVLERTYTAPYSEPVEYAEKKLSDGKDELVEYAKRFITMEHTTSNVGSHVTLKLIVQKPD